MSSDMKDTELKSILGEAPNWIFDYLELSDEIKREWKLGSEASDFGGHNQFVQTFAKRIEQLIKRETDKAVQSAEFMFASHILTTMSPLMVHRLEAGFPSMTKEIIEQTYAEVKKPITAYGDQLKQQQTKGDK